MSNERRETHGSEWQTTSSRTSRNNLKSSTDNTKWTVPPTVPAPTTIPDSSSASETTTGQKNAPVIYHRVKSPFRPCPIRVWRTLTTRGSPKCLKKKKKMIVFRLQIPVVRVSDGAGPDNSRRVIVPLGNWVLVSFSIILG